MTSAHLVRRAAEAEFVDVPAGGTKGLSRWNVVDENGPAVQTGFRVVELAPGALTATLVHSYEESFYLISGSAVVQTPAGAWSVGAGDYGLIPLGTPHVWRNVSAEPARFAELSAPQPRSRFANDTQFMPPMPEVAPVPVDARDPRNRWFGNIQPEHMEPGKQSQDLLAVSASMRTALLVYSGITVKMMVDSDLGAQLSTMFMVQYEAVAGVIGPHDHPLEETYLILEGEVEANFDGETYRLGVGDVGWAGVGCVHSFKNLGNVPVRWLETQAPAPPARHSYRFARDWDYLRGVIG